MKKVDTSNVNVKEMLGKLSVLKTNLSMLASIIIMVVAVLIFVPVKILSGSLEEAVKGDSLRKGSQIKSATSDAVSKNQWKELDKYKDDYERDANQISLLAMQTTQRELLSYDIFPSPNDTSSLIFKAFGERYQASIDGLLSGINARDCPSNEELIQGMAKASEASSARPGSPGSRPMGRGGAYRFGGTGIGTSLDASGVEATIRNEICLSRAKAISVYASPLDLAGYKFWGQYKYDVKVEDAVQDCWYYQLGYWIIEDIASTIGAMNAGSSQVFTSPVKRLMHVSFSEDVGQARLLGAAAYNPGPLSRPNEGVTTRPNYINKDEMTGFLADPHTNRVGDEDIDVVHFSFSVILEAKSVLPFMRELCSRKEHEFRGFGNKLPQAETFAHNQITILNSSFYAIAESDPLHALYRYGRAAMVELDLTCEYIFVKRAYERIKPEEVKPVPPQDNPAQGAANQR